MSDQGVNLIPRQEVLRRLAMSNSALYHAVADGLFTPPVQVSERRYAWPAHEVEAQIKARIAGKASIELRALVADLVARRGGAA